MPVEIYCIFFGALNLFGILVEDAITRLWILSIIGILQTIVILASSRKSNPFNVFAMIMILWAAQFSVVALLSLWFNIPFLKQDINERYLSDAICLENLCQLLFTIVWRMQLWTIIAQKAPRLSFPPLTDAKKTFFFMWLLSVVIRGSLLFKGYQPGYDVDGNSLSVSTNIIKIASGFLDMMPLLLYCSLLSSDSKNCIRYSLYVLFSEVGLNFFSGSKAGPVILLINFAVAYHYLYRPINTKKAYTLIIVALITLFPFYAIKSGVREIVTIRYNLHNNPGERPVLALKDYLDIYSEAINRIDADNISDAFKVTAEALVRRFDTVTTASGVISYYDKGNNHDFIEYALLWIKPYIPRFLWEDKGWVGLGLFISNIIMDNPYHTHSTPTSAVEGYIAAGIFGALILTIINAVFVKFTYIYMMHQKNSQGNSVLMAYFMANYLTVIFFVQSYTFIRSMFLNMLVLWLIFKVIRKTNTFFKVVGGPETIPRIL